MHLIGYALHIGRAMVVAVNKWDGLSYDQRQKVDEKIDRSLVFIKDFIAIKKISALHGTGVGDLFKPIQQCYQAATKALTTAQLMKVIEEAQQAHEPPMVRGRRVKLRYAHPGGILPPTIVIHGKQTQKLPGSYERYLMGVFRKAFKLFGTPVRLQFKQDDNPFEGQRTKLTPRQQRTQKRAVHRQGHLKKAVKRTKR
jgi:GTP-binding protein